MPSSTSILHCCVLQKHLQNLGSAASPGACRLMAHVWGDKSIYSGPDLKRWRVASTNDLAMTKTIKTITALSACCTWCVPSSCCSCNPLRFCKLLQWVCSSQHGALCNCGSEHVFWQRTKLCPAAAALGWGKNRTPIFPPATRTVHAGNTLRLCATRSIVCNGHHSRGVQTEAAVAG